MEDLNRNMNETGEQDERTQALVTLYLNNKQLKYIIKNIKDFYR